ncbi:MAG: type restriction enzyme subunit [Methanolobus sp.]|nr:type restriction enzyme subunit [Methanolobus sp.]
MTEGWKKCKLEDAVEIDSGFAFKSKLYSEDGCLKVVRGKNVTVGQTRWGNDAKYWNHSTDNLERYFLNEGDVVIGMDGSKIGENRAQIKKSDLPAILAQRVARLKAKDNSDQHFIWHLIFCGDFENYIKSVHTGTSIPHISQSQIASYDILLPPISEQRAIASVLSSLDDKIDLLHRQNKTLEAMAETLFRQWFVEEADEEWEEVQLKEVTDIAIGRTPPRKESQCFSTNPVDVKWISIKDLGNDGVFIFKTSEYLTPEAVKKFNVPIIPKDTVVLSFKMTVGRVAITTEDMLSNEAIAHFKFNNKTPFTKEYLYLFLKLYQYDSLGSTSSIVTAINSAMIKEMKIIIPDNEKMSDFQDESEFLFSKIRLNQKQIRTLEKLRDTLLPKLMSGEVRVEV